MIQNDRGSNYYQQFRQSIVAQKTLWDALFDTGTVALASMMRRRSGSEIFDVTTNTLARVYYNDLATTKLFTGGNCTIQVFAAGTGGVVKNRFVQCDPVNPGKVIAPTAAGIHHGVALNTAAENALVYVLQCGTALVELSNFAVAIVAGQPVTTTNAGKALEAADDEWYMSWADTVDITIGAIHYARCQIRIPVHIPATIP